MKGKKENIIAFKNGVPVGTFESMSKASKVLGVSHPTISLCLKTGRETKEAYSFDVALGEQK